MACGKNAGTSAGQVSEPAEPGPSHRFVHRSVVDVEAFRVVGLPLHAHLLVTQRRRDTNTIRLARTNHQEGWPQQTLSHLGQGTTALKTTTGHSIAETARTSSIAANSGQYQRGRASPRSTGESGSSFGAGSFSGSGE